MRNPQIGERTERGQRVVVGTSGYGVSEGTATQITLPSGKFMYVGVSSLIENSAKKRGLECKVVRYFGACIYANINDRAYDKFPIQIDEVNVAEFIDKIATKEECDQFHSQLR
ncbi:MAG: hypothetical protein PHW24_00890 [Candidatus Moranbacteria bacterium]|nr:hypothetical protein [Candidatus Moranbacteria bacterium]